jgi:hypothetical protein
MASTSLASRRFGGAGTIPSIRVRRALVDGAAVAFTQRDRVAGQARSAHSDAVSSIRERAAGPDKSRGLRTLDLLQPQVISAQKGALHRHRALVIPSIIAHRP